MKQENKELLKKYIICISVAAAITIVIFWIQGFFTSDIAVNLQILGDGFTVSGALLLMFAGMMFISGEGALVGITFVLRHAFLTLIPMGRARQETYRDYRERKLGEARKKAKDHVVFIVGLSFALIGIIFTVIWYMSFYTPLIDG